MTNEDRNLYNMAVAIKRVLRATKETALLELKSYSPKDKKPRTEERRKELREYIREHDSKIPELDAVINHLENKAYAEIEDYVKKNDLEVEQIQWSKEVLN